LEKDAMQLRILASARSSGQAFDLRCEIRERLIDWLQRKHPEALPRTRSLAQAEASDQKSLENAQTAAAIGADSAQTGTEA
jgi:hypothetical protein